MTAQRTPTLPPERMEQLRAAAEKPSPFAVNRAEFIVRQEEAKKRARQEAAQTALHYLIEGSAHIGKAMSLLHDDHAGAGNATASALIDVGMREYEKAKTALKQS